MVNNTILLRKDKSLTKSTFRTIYQNEHYADKIQFLLDSDFMNDEIRDYTITLFVVLPKIDELTGKPTTDRAKYLTLDEELYKGKHRIELPITITLTENIGEVIMWLQFTKENEKGEIDRHLTDKVSIFISASSSVDKELEDSESYDILTKLQEEIIKLKENKMDKYYEYNASTGELQFYANESEVGNAIDVEQEIQLINW